MARSEIRFGLHSIQHLIQKNPDQVLELYVQTGRDDVRLNNILQYATQHALSVQTVSKKTLDKLSDNGQHQGVLARCRTQPILNEQYLTELIAATKKPIFLLILDGVQDPHNLGACLRSADAAGIDAVICPKDRAVGLSPTVRKVACGGADTVPFIQVTNLARCLQQLREANIQLVGLADEAEKSLYQSNLNGAIALVLGSEEKGLRRLTRENCDELVHIPMFGTVESLNVSVATGICLFETRRQRNGTDS